MNRIIFEVLTPTSFFLTLFKSLTLFKFCCRNKTSEQTALYHEKRKIKWNIIRNLLINKEKSTYDYFNGYSVKNQSELCFFGTMLLKEQRQMEEYFTRIRNLREDKDLSQSVVASAIHVAQTTYSDYENGKVRIPIECLIELAKFYDVDMNYITGVSSRKSRFPEK